jgi:hypothetical protein
MLKAEGNSLRQIAEHFNSQGIRGSKNGKFHASTIQKILNNNIYDLYRNKTPDTQ